MQLVYFSQIYKEEIILKEIVLFKLFGPKLALTIKFSALIIIYQFEIFS